MLEHLRVCSDGLYFSSDSIDDGLWYFYMDIDRIHFASLPFSHQNDELLVSLSFSLRKTSIDDLSLMLSNTWHIGETPYTILYMVAIISTPWTDYDLFSLLLQQLCFVCQYVLFALATSLLVSNFKKTKSEHLMQSVHVLSRSC